MFEIGARVIASTGQRAENRTLAPPRFSVAEIRRIGLLVLVSLLLPSTARIPSVLAFAMIIVSVGASVRATQRPWLSVPIAVTVGFAPTIAMLGIAADVIGLAAPTSLRAWLVVTWIVASITLGTPVADRVVGRRTHVDVWARVLAVLSVSIFFGGALGRLLLPSRDTDLRLAWMLGEEDNAAFVGIAREVLTHGPKGDYLAQEFGTAFMNLPLAVLRLAGGPLAEEGDLRLQAITLTLLSAVVAIAIAGLAMALLASLTPLARQPVGLEPAAPPAFVTITGFLATAAGALSGFSLLAVMPLRAGFLSFLWGLSLVLLAAAVVAILPPNASTGGRLIVIFHLVAVCVLILRSWPFIIVALAPLFFMPALWGGRTALRRWRKAAAALAVFGATAAFFVIVGLSGVIAPPQHVSRVTDLGLDVLTVVGSSIPVSPQTVWLTAGTVIFAVALLLANSSCSDTRLLALLGPLAGAGALLLAIWLATYFLLDGIMAYAGLKLFFGLVALALVLGSLTVVSASTGLGSFASATALLVVALPHIMGVAAPVYRDWWESTERTGAPHAIATIAAIRSSGPEVPIRCLPSAGTPVTAVTTWAAYFCIRWIEQGFNEGRFDGNAFLFLNAESGDFSDLVELVTVEQKSAYLFAYRLTMGAGWFGWSGQ